MKTVVRINAPMVTMNKINYSERVKGNIQAAQLFYNKGQY